MEEKKKKTAEEKAQEHTASALLEMIIAKTFARHSQLTEQEFLAEIGFKDTDLSEEQVMRIACFNVLVELTKTILEARNGLQIATSILKEFLNEDKKGE